MTIIAKSENKDDMRFEIVFSEPVKGTVVVWVYHGGRIVGADEIRNSETLSSSGFAHLGSDVLGRVMERIVKEEPAGGDSK